MSEKVTFFSRTFTSNGHPLVLEFRKRSGQIEHRISTCEDDQQHPLLQSLHDCAEKGVSPCPAFSDLHDQRDAIFLTGATTVAHWSMSIEMIEQRLVFDAACRIKAELATFESAYRILSSRCRDRIDLAVEDAKLREVHNRLVRIVPTSPQPTEFPTTIQWRYSIACCSI